jgi:hypothetical protein
MDIIASPTMPRPSIGDIKPLYNFFMSWLALLFAFSIRPPYNNKAFIRYTLYIKFFNLAPWPN